MNNRKPRFVLIDPSFDGTKGDKWQYAVAFAQSAQAAGYDFHLVSNEASPSISGELSGIWEHRLFRYAFYEHDKIVSRHDRSPEHLREKGRVARFARLVASREKAVGKAWESNDRGGVELGERRLRSVKREAARCAAEREVRAAQLQTLPFNRDDYAEALSKALIELKLDKGDCLFFHTVTPAMMESLSEVSLKLGIDSTINVDAYFLFHFGAEAPDARTFLDRYHSYSHFGSLVDRLRSGSPFRRQYYLTTCSELSEECEGLFGVPFGKFDGLVNLDAIFRALKGERNEQRMRRQRQGQALAERQMRVGVRASDLTVEGLKALKQSVKFFKARGEPLDLRVMYHAGSLPLLRNAAAFLGNDVRFVNTDENDQYISELANSDVVILPYIAERYEKRVSAVLHDCSVLGVACIVPDGTTLAKSENYADIAVYSDLTELPGLLLRLWRSQTDEAQEKSRDAKLERARALYASDVVTRLLGAMPKPSLEVMRVGPKAVVIMPAWGRCGSSFAMEAQVRYLLSAGFFVVQIFVHDKPERPQDVISYFWSILNQNSQFTRGNVQRVVFATIESVNRLENSDEYLTASTFEQFQQRIAAAEIYDADVEAFCRQAQLTVVNHIFHSGFAHRWCKGAMILETHDIQSYQMVNWPLRNAGTDQPAKLGDLLGDEMAEVSRYDHVINVAPEEHAVLSLAAKSSTLIIPYVPKNEMNSSIFTVEQMAAENGWGEWYKDMKRIPLLLVGDAHAANLEAGEWFITEVFRPYLQPKGIILSVVGKLAHALFAKFEGEPYVLFTGYVHDLTTLRALSDVCVLPDQRGTGISIKALEAFAEGAAVVATNVALRGLGEPVQNMPRFDEPEAFAREVLRLLEDGEAREASRVQALAVYEAVSGLARFERHWDAILSELNSINGGQKDGGRR